MFPHKSIPCAVRTALGAWLLLAAAAAGAQVAGQVEFSRGVGFAQSAGQTPRTLGQGLDLKEGDRLTTSDGGSAIIKLQDGTRMTVRPNSELVISQYQFKENANDNGMVMQLVRGGFRAVTGLISKSSPNAARVQTSTATIGIRGTDFDARVCARECAQESQQLASAAARPNAIQASAKLFSVTGDVYAVDTSSQRRRLVDGGSVYPGDLVETMPGARAVLQFRDESRVSLGSGTRFRVDNFVFDDANAGEGRFLATVLRGSVRALTGLIAKANTRNVGFSTATATIGIRGTGVDIGCYGQCAQEAGANELGLTLFAWLGSISVTPQGTSALQVLQAGQGLFISPQGIFPVTQPPVMEGERPDTLTPPSGLFGTTNVVNDTSEGLFVTVRDGHIQLTTQSGQILDLGKGETGFAGGNTSGRPQQTPKFITFDTVTLPNAKNPMLVSVLAESGVKQQNQCK